MPTSSARLCPKCAGEVRDGWRVCPACAAPLQAETETVFTRALSSSSSEQEGRFPASTVLAGRYRILGLLGKGGMGEVYKAFDLILNQAVALKFLAPANLSEAALVRFRNEVRIARQVSHPNVCRVYDIGMVEGLHFISMEYLDGEDLDSLIRRIGRLAQDKAIEFARKICAGLSAAHERGVLHRDLKPANIMIDGRGKVRITDFGLAAVAAEIPLSDLRSGTPAYMSPEQKAGKEVTTRSDLYSLGLVLYEMFTGKRRADMQTNPTEIIKDLDPAVERVILRCLEEDPKRRPSSALNVAMALPGGDPIAVALAAGETPSPEMVAASTEREGFTTRAAWLCFGTVLLSYLSGLWLAGTIGYFARSPAPLPLEALMDRVQQSLKSIGYSEEPQTARAEFFCCDLQAAENVNRYEPARRAQILASHQPPIQLFRYHQHARRQANSSVGAIEAVTPSGPEPGLISEITDVTGKLIRLEVHAWPRLRAALPFDWASLFAAAGLDFSRFKPVAPEAMPVIPTDGRLAWTGTYQDDRSETVRVEAASWQGRPVFFEVTALPGQLQRSQPFGVNAMYSILFLSVVPAAVVAWRNLRQGRGDRQGARVIAGAFLALALAWWSMQGLHLRYNTAETSFLLTQLCYAAGGAGVFAVFYLAIEPYLRRNWPDSLISWTRLCAGRFRNSVVASHVVAGLAVGEVFGMIGWPLVGAMLGTNIGASDGPDHLRFAGVLGTCLFGVATGLCFVLVVVLLRLLLPKQWIADLVGVALFSVFALDTRGPWQFALNFVFQAAQWLVLLWLLRRFGLLAVLCTRLVVLWPAAIPVTITGWLAGRSMAVHLIPIALSAWAVWVILSAQRHLPTESAP